MNEHVVDGDEITRGVCRLLRELGYEVLTEFHLRKGRRADVIGLDRAGRFVIAEVKYSVADLEADHKWREYVPFSDRFYFAVTNDFPRDILPAETGSSSPAATAARCFSRRRPRPWHRRGARPSRSASPAPRERGSPSFSPPPVT